MKYRLAVVSCFVVVAASAAVNTPADPPKPVAVSKPAAGAPLPEGWTTHAPRDEIRPEFSYDPKAGPNGAGAFVITHDAREGLHGWFQKPFPVAGGKHYKFSAVRKAQGVAIPRRSRRCGFSGRTTTVSRCR